MKVYALALVSVFALAACTHSADNLTPKITTGDVKVSTTGGACPADVVADNNKEEAVCAGTDMDACNDATDAFLKKHPNVKCSITTSSGITFIDTTTTSTVTSGPTPVKVTQPSGPSDLCPSDLVSAFQRVSQYCADLDQESAASDWQSCQSVCRTYLNSYDTETCHTSSGTLISRSTVSEYADQADFNRFMHRGSIDDDN